MLLPETFLESDVQYEHPYTRTIDFTTDLETDEQTTENMIIELREKALSYLEENKVPQISYTVFVNVNESLEMGDTVHIKHPLCSIVAEVLEYEYNLISKKTKTITVGNYSRDVKTKFNAIKENINKVVERVTTQEKVIEAQTTLINSMNKNGLVYIDDNEILILDKIPREEAKNVWRFGLGGLGFSSNGYEGPFGIAMTMDGQINADFITTGQMNVARIKGLTDSLNKINTAIELNSDNIQSVVEEAGKMSSRISQNTSKIELKLDSSNFTSAAVINLINNRDGTSTAKINATNINLNGVVTANNYFKINLDGSAHSTNMTIEGNFAEGHGLRIKGKPAFVDFYANSSDITTRFIDYGEQFLFAGNKNFSFVNVSNSGYVGIMAESLYLNGTQCRVWTGGHELLLSCTANVSVVNPNNSAYMPMIASDFVTGSSRRYKENIVDMTEDEALKILDVLVKVFDYRADSKMRGKKVAGVIAEEIFEVIPNCVSMKEIDGAMVPDGVDYSKLVPYLIKGLQMLYEKMNRIGG